MKVPSGRIHKNITTTSIARVSWNTELNKCYKCLEHQVCPQHLASLNRALHAYGLHHPESPQRNQHIHVNEPARNHGARPRNLKHTAMKLLPHHPSLSSEKQQTKDPYSFCKHASATAIVDHCLFQAMSSAQLYGFIWRQALLLMERSFRHRFLALKRAKFACSSWSSSAGVESASAFNKRCAGPQRH